MTLIRHLVWHDLRSHRIVLLAFAAFLLIDAWIVLAGEEIGWRRVTELLFAARLVLVILVTGLVVQRDSLVGTTAFWRTRPIARPALLASKAVTLMLAGVALPGLIVWIQWLVLGARAGDAATVAASLMVEHATVVLLSAMAAVVTPSLTYLIVAGVAGGTMVSLFNTILLPALLTTWPLVGQSPGGYRPAIYLGTLFTLGVPAVAYQYLRLREWHTAALVAAAILAATVLTRVWPVAAAPPSPPVDTRVLDPAAIDVAIGPASLQRTEGASRPGSTAADQVSYAGLVTTTGQPPDVLLWTDTIESRLLLRDRTVTSTQRSSLLTGQPGVLSHDQTRVAALNVAIAPATLPEPVGVTSRVGRVPLTMVPLRTDRAYAGQRGLLTADVTLLARRPRVIGAMRPVPGARLTIPGAAATVLDAGTDGRSFVLRLRVARCVPGFLASWWLRPGPFTGMVLRNQRRREAVQSTGVRTLVARGVSIATSLRAEVLVQQYTFSTQGLAGGQVVIDDEWLAGAELLELETDLLGAFTRQVQTELVLGPVPADPRRP